MNRLWICTAVVLALLGTTMANSRYIDRTVKLLTDDLSYAHSEAHQGNWSKASRLTGQALERWTEHDAYLHIMLPHRDIDEILLIFREVEQYLALEEADQYNAANAKLVAQLELLSEMEQLTLKNVL